MKKLLIIASILFAITLNAESIKVNNGSTFKFFELYGYMAINNKMSQNLILDGDNPFISDLTDEKFLSWTKLKLHLEPVINIAETMEIHSKLTLLGDNVVGANGSYLNASTGEYEELNNNKVSVDAVWASVKLPIGTLRAGIMPFNWGLGILYNDGNSIKNPIYGDYVSRIEMMVPYGQYKIIPAIDITASGPVITNGKDYIDGDPGDNGYQFSIMFMKEENDPEVLKEKLLREQHTLQFGALLSYIVGNPGDNYRNKIFPYLSYATDVENSGLVRRNTSGLFTADAWVKYQYKYFYINAEGAYMSGKTGVARIIDEEKEDLETKIYALALESGFSIIPNKFDIYLNAGFASFDKKSSYASNYAPTLPIDESDTNMDTFYFNKGYGIRSVIWDEVYGRFGGGLYTTLGVNYFLTSTLSLGGGTTYSTTFKSSISPSGNGANVALEPYIELTYKNDNGLRAGFDYQLAFPLDGMPNDNLSFVIHTYLGFVF